MYKFICIYAYIINGDAKIECIRLYFYIIKDLWERDNIKMEKIRGGNIFTLVKKRAMLNTYQRNSASSNASSISQIKVSIFIAETPDTKLNTEEIKWGKRTFRQ